MSGLKSGSGIEYVTTNHTRQTDVCQNFAYVKKKNKILTKIKELKKTSISVMLRIEVKQTCIKHTSMKQSKPLKESEERFLATIEDNFSTT